jgi:hypothetical protein
VGTEETARNLLIPIELLDLGLTHEEVLDLEALGPILPHTPVGHLSLTQP